MKMMKSNPFLALCLLAAFAGVGSAEVARFQNGVAPTPAHSGCVDTRISIYNDAEARRSAGKAQNLLTFSSARRILVRFDITSVPAEHAVRRALLRVYCTASASSAAPRSPSHAPGRSR